MNKIKKWFRKNTAIFALAMANVEKDLLTQKDPDGADVSHTLNINQNTLSDDLERGILSVAVQELRWRMYETLNRTQELKSIISHYITDADGTQVPVYTTKEISAEDIRRSLSKVKLDSFDNYSLAMVIDNSPITIAGKDIDLDINENGKIEEFDLKQERPIQVYREAVCKFNIENYAKKLHVRNISEDEKLLEFVFSKFADQYDKKSTLFISELKRALVNPRSSNMLDIREVGFITLNSVGAKDLLEFTYEIVKFDKIVEFNGNYIIKFIAKPIINGVSLTSKYDGGKLQEKYNKKEARKTL